MDGSDATHFGGPWWEQHYRQGAGNAGAANVHVVAEVADLTPGSALDAGCGDGAASIWLDMHGWDVTAVDIAPTVIERAKELAGRVSATSAARIHWRVEDLTTWQPAHPFDLVVSQYVHTPLPFVAFVARLAAAVAPGGTLLVVGHDHGDAHSAAHAPVDPSIDIAAVTTSLDAEHWHIHTAEHRGRIASHDSDDIVLRDVVVRATRTV